MLCPRTAERMYDMYMIHAYWSQCQVLARPLPRASPICSSGISNGQCFTFWRGWGCGRWTGASKGSGQLKTQGTSGNSVDVDFILCSVCVYIWTCMNIYIYIVFIFVCMFISLGAYCIWVCKFVGICVFTCLNGSNPELLFGRTTI